MPVSAGAKYKATGSTDTSTDIMCSTGNDEVETEASRCRIGDFLRLKLLDDNSSAKAFSHPEGAQRRWIGADSSLVECLREGHHGRRCENVGIVQRFPRSVGSQANLPRLTPTCVLDTILPTCLVDQSCGPVSPLYRLWPFQSSYGVMIGH